MVGDKCDLIQAIRRPDFEDVLRTGALWRSFMTPIASALTLGPLWLAQVASQNPGGGVPPRGAAELAKVPAPSSGTYIHVGFLKFVSVADQSPRHSSTKLVL